MIPTKIVKILFALSITGLIFLSGCGSKLAFKPGLELVRQGHFNHQNIPDSLRVIFKITLVEGKRKQDIVCVCLAKPYLQYRLDFKGPFGVHLADFHWAKNAGWELSVPSEEIEEIGVGDGVDFGFIDLYNLPLHSLMGLSWNNGLGLGDYEFVADQNGSRIFLNKKDSSQIALSLKNGHLKQLSAGEYIFKPTQFKKSGNSSRINQFNIYHQGILVAKVRYQKVQFNPGWKKSPFKLYPKNKKTPSNLTTPD